MINSYSTIFSLETTLSLFLTQSISSLLFSIFYIAITLLVSLYLSLFLSLSLSHTYCISPIHSLYPFKYIFTLSLSLFPPKLFTFLSLSLSHVPSPTLLHIIFLANLPRTISLGNTSSPFLLLTILLYLSLSLVHLYPSFYNL